MLGKSRFLTGLLGETPDAVKAQVDLWDQSNIGQAAWSQATSRSSFVRQADAAFKEHVGRPIGQKVNEKLQQYLPETFGDKHQSSINEFHRYDHHIMKLCRLVGHANLSLQNPPDLVQIHDFGLEIERDAVRTLRSIDNRGVRARLRREAKTGFEGSSIDDMVRYVIQRTFQVLDEEFQKKSLAEQEKIAEEIAEALHDLPPAEQERVRQAAGLPDLTAETLKQTAVLASVGLGVSSLVGFAGFSAYTTLTSLVASVTGFIGITLPFSGYMALTSLMAGITNPLFFIPAIAGGGAWMMSKANRSIRDTLYPILVTNSILASSTEKNQDSNISDFELRIGELIHEINNSTGSHLISLIRQFPGLGSPPLSAKLAKHVAT